MVFTSDRMNERFRSFEGQGRKGETMKMTEMRRRERPNWRRPSATGSDIHKKLNKELKMNETAEAMKMMSDGFALLAKGFAEMVKRMSETTATTVVAATGDEDTRTVTLPEAAKRLGLSRSTIDRLCEAGELEFVKDRRSGYRRITVAGIVAYHRRRHDEAKKMKEAA